ncbi:Rho termination factor N-terminal domain-containing protein [Micromonospora sp. DR5-3]|uniref:Rho termination factor N-terminal domain-containing protein n=1 Tax=unclassified Micromonospora TaxID=2617518 RepID=UPI0011D6AD7E|nr:MULTISPECIES: Rho termination factor N-terminal domain-containing protein [unclassified Micromonospora]MCW3815543.1 Rho termination factor N-terminal domain-containing protein [Micromonospora sp. DR5-3]TYC19830.1 hypothetical protein FXF52_34635 [Micromonospora sp. MP36]
MTEPTRAVLARVAEFLGGLSAADVAALAEGRARLALLPTTAADPAPPAPGVAPTLGDAGSAPAAVGRPAAPGGVPGVGSQHVEQAHAALTAMSRRDDGTAYLASWTARDLRALAARAGLRGVVGLRKSELVERIVERTIGFRLNSTAIRQR